MRYVLVLVVLLLTACEGSFVRSGDLGRKVNIEKSYEARDACLARNAAADGVGTEDPTTLAHAAALACSAETDKLIAASDLSGDTKVANQIRQDSEFRALGFVMKARGQAIFWETGGREWESNPLRTG
jgi:hypothetical protein